MSEYVSCCSPGWWSRYGYLDHWGEGVAVAVFSLPLFGGSGGVRFRILSFEVKLVIFDCLLSCSSYWRLRCPQSWGYL